MIGERIFAYTYGKSYRYWNPVIVPWLTVVISGCVHRWLFAQHIAVSLRFWCILETSFILLLPPRKSCLRSFNHPPFSPHRFAASNKIGFMTGMTTLVLTRNYSFLNWLPPVGIAIGIWLIGNLGNQKGVIWHCLSAAFIAYSSATELIQNETFRYAAVTLVSSIAFELISKEEDIQIQNRRHHLRSPLGGRLKKLFELVQMFTNPLITFCSLLEFYRNFDNTIFDTDDLSTVYYHFAMIWWKILKQLYNLAVTN